MMMQGQARMEEQIKTLFRQQAELRALTETVQRLAVTLERKGAAVASTERKVEAMKSDVDELRSRPTRRWETLVATVLSALAAFVLTHMGLK